MASEQTGADLIWLVLLVNLPVFLLTSPVNLLLFWDWIACKLITLFVIFFHAIILPDYRFFFEVPRIEEVQDPNSSPRREEVGRRTLRDYGGFLPSFFCRARFRFFGLSWGDFNHQKLPFRGLQTLWEY